MVTCCTLLLRARRHLIANNTQQRRWKVSDGDREYQLFFKNDLFLVADTAFSNDKNNHVRQWDSELVRLKQKETKRERGMKKKEQAKRLYREFKRENGCHKPPQNSISFTTSKVKCTILCPQEKVYIFLSYKIEYYSSQ